MADYYLTQTGPEVQDILDSVGDLSDLVTTDKDTVVDAINEVAGMSPEIATVSTPGIVQPDGDSISVDVDGIISVASVEGAVFASDGVTKELSMSLAGTTLTITYADM